jgi:DNA excision repair protein ERCC-3
MTAEFYREYLKKEHSMRRRQLLYILNPVKFRVCEHLVHVHEDRGDKIIIFSDDIVALELYCKALERPFIHGQTPEHERTKILVAFKTHPQLNCIGLSRVGDTALDIPEANVVIQVSSHFGARRQEAQRLGRILRPKQNQGGEFNAFFYTLVSTDTREMFFSAKRQQYLVDQGYTFKVLEDLAKTVEERSAQGISKSRLLSSKNQELQLLSRVLSVDTKATDEGEDRAIKRSTEGSLAIHNLSVDGAGTHLAHLATGSARESTHTNVLLINSQPGALRAKTSFLSGAKRKSSTLGGLSGVDGTSYLEFDAKKK